MNGSCSTGTVIRMTSTVGHRPAGRAAWHGWLPVWSLGLYTITAYGTWAYAFGVLIEPINAETGWTTSFLGSVYGVAMLLTGLSAFWSGRLLDRFGPAVPLGLHAIVASGLMLAAISVDRQWLFGLLFASGAGLSGATGFYTMTTVIAARSRPDRPDRAIAVLTLVGAFCSPIYLPLSAWLLTVWDWRTVARALILAGVLGAVQAGLVTARVRLAEEDEIGGAIRPSARSWDAVKRSMAKPDVRRALAVYFLAGASAGTMWVYQVPMMVGTGLGLGLAGTLAGLRGFCQIFGRMGLTGAVERHGSARLLQGAYVITAVGGVALLVASVVGLDSRALVVGLSLVFALLAGTGFGASSPLQAIHARLHFDPGDLGLLMGLQGAVLGLAGAVGPMVGAFLRDATGSWIPTITAVVSVLLLSALLLRPGTETG